MKIIVSHNYDPSHLIQKYKFENSSAITPIRDLVGTIITPIRWVLASIPQNDGSELEILIVEDESGEVMSTASGVFKRTFFEIHDVVDGKPYRIKVVSGKTKAGKQFYKCNLVSADSE